MDSKVQERPDNSLYFQRFQFQLKANDNIICQRYFKIAGFNEKSLYSAELLDAVREIVERIKRNFESKSRIYLANNLDRKVKLTGFSGGPETYAEYDKKVWDASDVIEPWSVMFTFSFIVDGVPIVTEAFDGSVYPRYVRNSVDITNSGKQYPMLALMNQGKEDLVPGIIREICSACSDFDRDREYTRSLDYGTGKHSYRLDVFRFWNRRKEAGSAAKEEK